MNIITTLKRSWERFHCWEPKTFLERLVAGTFAMLLMIAITWSLVFSFIADAALRTAGG